MENMQNNIQKQPSPIQTRDKEAEEILVVKRSDIFAQEPAWSGLKKVDFDHYISLIQEKKEFLPRGQMEVDPSYKQIIPYLVFNYEDTYFLMQRKAKSTEKRLQNKYSLGIGGHIRKEDTGSNSIFEWAKREFQEEVHYSGKLDIEPLGILNDDSNAVGQVHIGFVFLLKGDNPDISIKSELESGTLLRLDECKDYFNSMESWSQIVFEFLVKNNTQE